MARYCIAYDSMKQFLEIKGKESLSDLVSNFFFLRAIYLFIYWPIIVKINIVHLVFVGLVYMSWRSQQALLRFLEEIPDFTYQLNY